MVQPGSAITPSRLYTWGFTLVPVKGGNYDKALQYKY